MQATAIYTSIASRDGRWAAGVVIHDAAGSTRRLFGRPLGAMPPDEAAYRAILRGLWIARRLGARRARVFTEDLALVDQLEGRAEVPAVLVGLYLQTKAMLNAYRWTSVEPIARDRNAEAALTALDALDRGVPAGAGYDEDELAMPLWQAAEKVPAGRPH